MIKQVNTKSVIYKLEEGTNIHWHDLLVVYNCSFQQTNYGSVIITTEKHKIEIYPQLIEKVYHLKE